VDEEDAEEARDDSGPQPELLAALREGDPQKVATLIDAGADVLYRRKHGYRALVDAVHGRDLTRDPRLLDLLRILIIRGVDLDAETSYAETALRVLSHLGLFDAVRLLLEAGADRRQLQWSPLIEAVALGTLAEVEGLLAGGAALEERDWWSRSAWHVALLKGDRDKAHRLAEKGADVDARGRCGKPSLFYAIEGHHPKIVQWLLALGQDSEQTDDFGVTPLMSAAEHDDLECLEALLDAGVDVNRQSPSGSALQRASSRTVARRLLDAGADPGELPFQARRAMLSLPPPDTALLDCSLADFLRAPTRYFGRSNPEQMNELFWKSMICSGVTAFAAARHFGQASFDRAPVWCAERYGQSLTFLPDGRVVQIGGEHEDAYDPDFCIYNDVFVHECDGSVAIFGYLEAVFPPTDFHTATLVRDGIYVIGSLGYPQTRRHGVTPVYRLDLRTFRIEPLETTGEAPGWISRHRAALVASRQIHISGGKVAVSDGEKELYADHSQTFVLDLDGLRWRRS